MPETVTETLRRGLKDLFAAEVLTDDNGTDGYTTGTTFYLIPAGEMSRQVSTDKSPVFFDDVVFYTSGKEGETEVSITGASLRQEKIAQLLAKDIDATTGAMIDSGDYKEKYYALGGTTENVDGTEEKFWFAKGTFSLSSRSDKTKDDSTDTNGDELSYNAVRTKHKFTYGGETKPIKKVVIDTLTSRVKANKDWTNQVVTPDNLTEIVERVSA
jgi:phi13 family phage major tail protein